MSFEALVLGWLHANDHPLATRVLQVKPFGTDWAGDTVAGFHSSFGVTIYFEPDGCVFVEGEAMESLWTAVVSDGGSAAQNAG